MGSCGVECVRITEWESVAAVIGSERCGYTILFDRSSVSFLCTPWLAGRKLFRMHERSMQRWPIDVRLSKINLKENIHVHCRG